MLTEKEIRYQLADCKKAVAEYEALEEETNVTQPDALIFQGYVEALTLVLDDPEDDEEIIEDDEEITEDVQRAINTIADLFLQSNFCKNTNGTFAHANSIEYVDEIHRWHKEADGSDGYTVETGWEAVIAFGSQDDAHTDSYEERIWVTQLDIDEWIAGKAEKWYPRFQQDQFDDTSD